ncbi:MAG: DNA primase [Actinomycetota bacterium]
MAIAEDDIERLRDTVSLVDVVQGYLQLRRVGRNWVGLCPFHAEKSGSFNVREETKRYRCFGCGASGDVFTFVQEMEHVDFVGSIEHLANKVGMQLTYTNAGQGKDRQRRKRLVEVMNSAVDWYHERLLTAPDARAARDYLRERGLAGDVARQFKLGWAPDDWDQLAKGLGVPMDVLQEVGLAFVNKRGRPQDSFRARVMFPIFTDSGDAVAFGGRILPGSTDPAKYKNSSETTIYAKSKTLYGLNWAKANIVAADEVIVCEGYTDVIGFHRAGVARAVATCGTALTEEHVRLLKRFANKVVLAFDADAAGQGAAERFYEWEKRYEVQVSVARFPAGKDPGELASSDPATLVEAVTHAKPFLGFRLDRVLASEQLTTPESRSRVANNAMAVINEHPDKNVRTLYAGEVASHTGIPVADLVAVAAKGVRGPQVATAQPRASRASSYAAEFVAIALMIQQFNEIATYLIEPLFSDETYRRAFVALKTSEGDLNHALSIADPEAREALERAAVADVDVKPVQEAINLVGAAVRRELAQRTRLTDSNAIQADRAARLRLEDLADPRLADDATAELLAWLESIAVNEVGEQ